MLLVFLVGKIKLGMFNLCIVATVIEPGIIISILRFMTDI